MLRWVHYLGWWVVGIIWLAAMVVFTLVQLRRDFGRAEVPSTRGAPRPASYRLWPAAGPYSQTGWEIVSGQTVKGEQSTLADRSARVVTGLGEGAFQFTVEGSKLCTRALRPARRNNRFDMPIDRPVALLHDDVVEVAGARFSVRKVDEI